MAYAVQLSVFEGPFDLLLDLILKEEVDLYAVSLHGIVDAYLAELAAMDHCDLEITTEFLLIASILVELKTRRLLPDAATGDLDDEFSLWEHRDLLLARLIECKTFKDASKMLRDLAIVASRSVPRTAGPEEKFFAIAPDPFANMTAEKLRAAYGRAIRPKPIAPEFSVAHITVVKASVSEAIERIARRLERAGSLTFRQITAGLSLKVDVVVCFLALLELYKQGLIELDQLETFGSIEAQWIGTGPYGLALDLVDAYDG